MDSLSWRIGGGMMVMLLGAAAMAGSGGDGGAMPATAPAPAQSAATRPAGPATAPALPLVPWSSERFRVRLRYPRPWHIVATPPVGTVFSAHIPLHDPPGPAATISLRMDRAVAADKIGPDPSGTDRAAMMDIADAMAAYVFNNGGRKVTIRPDTLGSKTLPGGAIPARRVRYLTDLPSGPAATLDVVAVKNGIAYVWTISGPAGSFDPLLPQVQQMLDSFETLQ